MVARILPGAEMGSCPEVACRPGSYVRSMTDIDPNRMENVVEQIQGHLAGAATVLMIHLGDQLGLYDELASGPQTPGELAQRTGYEERYLAEWMGQQAVAGILSFDPENGRFALGQEHAVVLTAEETPFSFGGAFQSVAGMYSDADEIARCVASGSGIGWGDHDPHVHRGTARFFGAAYRQNLVDEWVPAAGLSELLDRGARVADVGCGEGVTTVLLASAFPNSSFIGIDPHEPSIDAATKRATEAGVSDRVDFMQGDVESFTGGPYDAVWLFDMLHDLPAPSAAVRTIKSQLADDGVLGVVEPAAGDDMAENIATNPAAALHYTASTFLCIPNSLTHPDGAALGGQAGGRILTETIEDGGFKDVKRVATTPVHHVYTARP